MAHLFLQRKHFLRCLRKACPVTMAPRDSITIAFVIIHGNELHAGSFFWLNLISVEQKCGLEWKTTLKLKWTDVTSLRPTTRVPAFSRPRTGVPASPSPSPSPCPAFRHSHKRGCLTNSRWVLMKGTADQYNLEGKVRTPVTFNGVFEADFAIVYPGYQRLFSSYQYGLRRGTPTETREEPLVLWKCRCNEMPFHLPRVRFWP